MRRLTAIALFLCATSIALAADSYTATQFRVKNPALPTFSHDGIIDFARYTLWNSLVTTGPLTATGPLVLDNARYVLGGAAAMSIPKATTSVDGYLAKADWKTFNDKQSTFTQGDLTAATPLQLSANRQVIGGATVLTIGNAAADGVTKGVAGFKAADFNATLGIIDIDYTNGQKASASLPGFMTAEAYTSVTAISSTVVPVTRNLTAGAGLTGGGTLAADRTFNVGAGAGIVVNADDVALGTPTTTTLGGVMSWAGRTDQWIYKIGTDGVPASSQPGFSNLSGSIADSQIPAAITRDSEWDTAAEVLAAWGSTPWEVPLTFSTGLTRTVNAVALTPIADQRMFGNVSGGSLAPSAMTQAQVQTFIGTLPIANFPTSYTNTVRAMTFNVKDYGAVGNSTTDDTAAIQACIDAARYYRQYSPTTTGYHGVRVIIPAGEYKVTAPLNIHETGVSDTTREFELVGIGMPTIHSTDTNATHDILSITSTYYYGRILVEGIQFWGSTLNRDGIHVVAVPTTTIKNCTSWYNGNAGIYFDGTWASRIQSCLILGSPHGIYLTNSAGNQTVIENCFIYTPTGIWSNNATDLSILNNDIEGFTSGTQLTLLSGATIAGNQFESDTGCPIYATSCTNINFRDNFFMAPIPATFTGNTALSLRNNYSYKTSGATNNFLLSGNNNVSWENNAVGGTGVDIYPSVLQGWWSTAKTILLPTMTTAQVNALTAIAGMVAYDSTLGAFKGYDGAWRSFCKTASSGLTLDSAGNMTLNDLSGTYQPLDSDLTYLAGFTPTANVKTILNAADYAAIKTALSLVIGTNVQAYDADLTTYAGITPSANIQTLLGSATYSAARDNLAIVANPTATVNGTATNGTANTATRSDGSPALADPFTPADGTQNITGAVTASGAVTGSNLSGTNTGDQTIPAAANPTATLTSALQNGVATTFMRSDGAPALPQTLSTAGTPQFANIGIGNTANAVAGAYLRNAWGALTGTSYDILTQDTVTLTGNTANRLNGFFWNPTYAMAGFNGTASTIANPGIRGILLTPTVSGASGTMSVAVGMSEIYTISGGAVVTDHYGIALQNPSVTGGSVLTNNYALHIASQTAGGTKNYGIYQAGTGGLNVLAGNTRIGGTTDATVALDVTGNVLFTGYMKNATASTIAAGVGAGTTPTVTIAGNAVDGQVQVITGTLPTGASAIVCTVTPGVTAPGAWYPTITPANAITAALSGVTGVYAVGANTTTWTINSGTTALTAATTYLWSYHAGMN